MLRLSNILILLFCLSELCAQTIEAESRTYQFSIDMMMEIEGEGRLTNANVLPYKVQISDLLEQKLSGTNLAMDQSNEAYKDLVKESIQEIGLHAFDITSLDCYLLEEELKLEIQLKDFKAFKVSIPLAEVEAFKNNFAQIEFSDQQFAMNENEEFVVTYLKMYNPKNKKKYIFYNTEDESVKAPSFSVSLPKEEL